MIRRMDIFGSSGIPMRVLYIPANEKNPHLPDTVEPFKEDSIAFYDASHLHTPDGQFVSDYYVSTLCEGDARETGVNLYGGVPEWRVSAMTIRLVLDWVRYITNLTRT